MPYSFHSVYPHSMTTIVLERARRYPLKDASLGIGLRSVVDNLLMDVRPWDLKVSCSAVPSGDVGQNV